MQKYNNWVYPKKSGSFHWLGVVLNLFKAYLGPRGITLGACSLISRGMAWEARKKEGFFLILSCIHYYIGNQNMAFIIFFTAVYNQERLILQTIYVSTKQGNSSIKSSVCNQERVIMARVWYPKWTPGFEKIMIALLFTIILCQNHWDLIAPIFMHNNLFTTGVSMVCWRINIKIYKWA